MLSKMEGNGQVMHRSEGRVLVYRPAIRRETVSRSMVADLAERLFAGGRHPNGFLICSMGVPSRPTSLRG